MKYVAADKLNRVVVLCDWQTTEEELFANTDHSPAFDEFLQLVGSRVKLKDFAK